MIVEDSGKPPVKEEEPLRGKFTMVRNLKNVAFITGALILFFFVLFVINQTASVVELASRLSPTFGTMVLWFLIGLYAFLLLAMMIFYIRLPKPLKPLKSEAEPQFSMHLEALRKRLAVNPLLEDCDLSDRAGLEKALEVLNSKCDLIIRDGAANVFVSTAISQSGRLDAIFVLTAHFQMVWRIARLYSQRPAFRELVNLYANVAATAFVATHLDEAEISELLAPILSSTLGVISMPVPGAQVATSIVVNSIVSGAANAFLTLRVGIIARRYCGSLLLSNRQNLRRTATTEAAKLLGSIVKVGTSRISKAMWQVSKNKMGTTFSGFTGVACEVRDSLFEWFKIKKSEE